MFILLFFSWNGLYPGGYGVYTQNGWQAIGGWFHSDPAGNEELGELDKHLKENIHASWLVLLFILLLLASLVLAIGSMAAPHVRAKLHPQLQPLLQWSAALVSLFSLVALILLILQLFVGLGLENAAQRYVDNKPDVKDRHDRVKTPEENEKYLIYRGEQLGALQVRRTTWLCLEVILNIIALIGAALEFWLSRRGNRPLPRIELQW